MIEPLTPGGRTRIGPYRLLGSLGAGGMGEVYLARADSTPDAGAGSLAGLVALKTVLPGLDLDDGFRVRFRREIAAAGAVRGPHFAALVAGDESGGTPWLATEYVPGPSLAEAVSRTGPLPESVVRAVGSRLALALADMHAVRVLHRDLKPGNVLLGADGPKIIDFGIAQAFEATQLTRTGVVVGSPGYISPEHVNGSTALVPASDVFCLGAVLAFAACGRGPFDDPDMAAVIFRIAHGEPELDRVPAGLRAVIERCLAPRPEDRPAPYELAGLLAPGGVPESFPWHDAVREQCAAHTEMALRCAGSVPVPVVPPPPATPPTPPAPALTRRRRPRAVMAALAVVCAVLGTVLLPGLLDGDARTDDPAAARPDGPASSAAGGAGPTVVSGADAARTGDFGARGADLAARPAGWKPWTTGERVGEYGCLLSAGTLVCSGERGVTALDAARGTERWNVPGESGPGNGKGSRSVVTAVDGTVYAFVPGALVGLRLTDGKEVWRRAVPGGQLGAGAVYSDGVIFYVSGKEGGSAGRLTAQQITGEEKPEKWAVEYAGSDSTLLAGDGRVVAVGSGIQIFDAGSGKELPGVGEEDTECAHPLLKDRDLICVARGGLTVTDTSAPAGRRTLAQGMEGAMKPAVTADGTVVVSAPGQVRAFRLRDGEELWYHVDTLLDENAGNVSIVGDRAFVHEAITVSPYDLDGSDENPPGAGKLFDMPIGGTPPSLIAHGDALFLSSPDDGRVLSGFAP
ncbi:protein kinase domain-containing protein [Streptomyces pratensis]|uniref:serine/threonine-protein kinase n=1 Tax=Streptomyces pratensis TaxID=1169025 RepID=UPI001934AC8D|nr:serine/threonine-protein kinase [Streptomyces pratensis]